MAEQIPFIQLRQSTVTIVLQVLTIQACVAALGILLHLLGFWVASESIVVRFAVILAAVSLAVFNAIVIIGIALRWANTTYTITPTEIIAQEGIFTLKRAAYKSNHVEEVDVRESFLGKLFNFGTIKFFNPVLNRDVFLINIPEPIKHSEILKNMDNKERILFLPSHSNS